MMLSTGGMKPLVTPLWILTVALVAAQPGCGRSAPLEDETVVPVTPVAPVPKSSPLFVFTTSECPTRGNEEDLIPSGTDQLAVVRFRAVSECSGAGGEWFVGREVSSSRAHLAGRHACYFLPQELQGFDTDRFAVVRFQVTAGLFRAPKGWCVTDEQGNEVTTDARALAWGIYATEADAQSALERLRDD